MRSMPYCLTSAQRLRPERSAKSPRESDPSTTLRVDLRLSKVERGWGPASAKS